MPSEKDNWKLTVFILEREVDVPGSGAAQVGYFAFDPAVGIGSLNMATDFYDERADGPDTTRLLPPFRWKEQSHLVYGTAARRVAELIVF